VKVIPDASSRTLEGDMAPDDPVFSAPVLVLQRMSEQACLIYDREGRQIGAVQQGVHPKLRVTAADGRVLLDVTPPPMTVTDGAGAEVGRIVPEIVFGRTRFALRSGGRRCGSVHAADLRGWDFAVLDDAGTEVARITRTRGSPAGELGLAQPDHVLQVRRPLPHPLRELVVAATLTV
jgi:hypothetical protein